MSTTSTTSKTTRTWDSRLLATCRFIALLMLFLGLAAQARAGDVGRCLTAVVQDPIVLPDGKLVQPEHIRICYKVAYSPVMGLHEISIDGNTIGMYMSRSTDGPRPEQTLDANANANADRPFLIFLRNARGELELYSYHRPAGDELHNHVFAVDGKPRVTSHWNLASNSKEQRKARKRGFDLATVMEHETAVVIVATAP